MGNTKQPPVLEATHGAVGAVGVQYPVPECVAKGGRVDFFGLLDRQIHSGPYPPLNVKRGGYVGRSGKPALIFIGHKSRAARSMMGALP